MSEDQVKRINMLLLGLQITLESLDELEREKYYARQLKAKSKTLKEEVEKQFAIMFKGASLVASDYYTELMDFLKWHSSEFQKIYEKPEDEKQKLILALDNFYKTNNRQ